MKMEQSAGNHSPILSRETDSLDESVKLALEDSSDLMTTNSEFEHVVMKTELLENSPTPSLTATLQLEDVVKKELSSDSERHSPCLDVNIKEEVEVGDPSHLNSHCADVRIKLEAEEEIKTENLYNPNLPCTDVNLEGAIKVEPSQVPAIFQGLCHGDRCDQRNELIPSSSSGSQLKVATMKSGQDIIVADDCEIPLEGVVSENFVIEIDFDGHSHDCVAQFEIQRGTNAKQLQTCEKSFASKPEFQNKSIGDSAGKNSYVCSECGKMFSSDCSLRCHMKIHTGEMPYYSGTCGKEFVHKSYLNSHIRIHTRENPFEGVTCGKTLVQKGQLNHHIINTFSDKKPYECITCGKRYSTKSYLKQHIRSHTEEKPHECVVCGKIYSTKSALKQHMRYHTGEKPYKCGTCGKTFTQKISLDCHIITHTGEKPYECGICGKKFTLKSDLDRHITIHTGDRPYECGMCGKTFLRESILNTHIRTHTRERPFECVTCGKTFSYKSQLTCHIRIHTGEKPYECQKCNEKFSQRYHLISHMCNSAIHGEESHPCSNSKSNKCSKLFSSKLVN